MGLTHDSFMQGVVASRYEEDLVTSDGWASVRPEHAGHQFLGLFRQSPAAAASIAGAHQRVETVTCPELAEEHAMVSPWA